MGFSHARNCCVAQTDSLLRLTVAACLCVLPLTAGCGGEDADDRATGTTPPDVVVVRGKTAEKDFGYVEIETPHLAAFRLMNDTDRALELTKLFSDCPCITVESHPSSIPPGTAGDVCLKYQSSEKREPYSGSAVVFTSDPARPQVRLVIRARVGLPLAVKADLADGPVAPGETLRGEILLVNEGPEAVRTLHADCDDPAVRVQLPQVSVPAGKAVRVPFEIRAEGMPGGRLATVAIGTDCCSQGMIRVPLRYEVAGNDGNQTSPTN